MSRASDGQVIKIIFVSCDVPGHGLLAVNSPGAPGLRLLKAEACRPVLASEAVERRVRVSVVHKYPERPLGHHFLVKRQQFLDIGHVDEAVRIVLREIERVRGVVQGLLDAALVDPNLQRDLPAARICENTRNREREAKKSHAWTLQTGTV